MAAQWQYHKVQEQLKFMPPLLHPMMSDLDDFKKAGHGPHACGTQVHSKIMNKTNKSLAAFQEPITKVDDGRPQVVHRFQACGACRQVTRQAAGAP
jgi:hypothetical protein